VTLHSTRNARLIYAQFVGLRLRLRGLAHPSEGRSRKAPTTSDFRRIVKPIRRPALPIGRSFRDGAENYAISRLLRQPVLLANDSVSIPMRCIMLTNRLQSGALLSRLKAMCWPCLNPPPANRIGKLVLS